MAKDKTPGWLEGIEAVSPLAAIIKHMNKGGKVKKTGNYKLHKGERVVPKTRKHR